MLNELIKQLTDARPLANEQVAAAVDELADEGAAAETKAQFLTALARKGETIDEIAAFVRALRDKSIPPVLDAATRSRPILDVCGTGGDRMNTFNISTTVALMLAAAGVAVAKHGNRAITSPSGSADVIEALGIRTQLTPAEAGAWLRDRHFAFFFAPSYHPAFRHIAPARRLCADRGQRTIFNYLGPLLNPARPTAQLIGVPHPALCESIARVLQSLGVGRGMVVCGQAGPGYLDEFSTMGDTTVAEFYQPHGFAVATVAAGFFPSQPAVPADLIGGDRQANAATIRNLFQGRERGPKRDAVLANAAAALLVAGRTSSLQTGWDVAGELLDSGRAYAKLEELAAL